MGSVLFVWPLHQQLVRIVSIQSHRIILLAHPLLYIATLGHVAQIWEFSSAGGPTWTCVQEGS